MNKIVAVTFESPLSAVSGEIDEYGALALDVTSHSGDPAPASIAGLSLATATALRDVLNALLPACTAGLDACAE